MFIRRQKEKHGEFNEIQWNRKNLAEDQDVIQLILTVAKHSYETLKRSEIIFEADESEVLSEIEKMGLLVKSTKRETWITIYQFQHLTFQELFAAVRIVRMDEVDRNLLDNPILQACLTIVAGLEGLFVY